MKKNVIKRRVFLKNTGLALTGMAISAKSYARISGANDRLNCAILGLNGRGTGLLNAFPDQENVLISHLCDVDKRLFDKTLQYAEPILGYKPAVEQDFRKIMENKDIDVVVVALPDHWHTPMTLYALQAGKHVYLEKPCSYNPQETEFLLKAKNKSKQIIQVGTQQRSAPTSIQAIQDIKDGLIGDVYYGKCWYANNRGSIGHGSEKAVPDGFDWDLWQGPAPRRAFKDNYIHYNWHWFQHWGTGEIHNNATHEVDICRWALGVDFPTEVNSSGGRFHFEDDWQFYDTQVVNYRFPGKKMICWEGRSCNPYPNNGWDRGSSLHGTNGTILIDRNNYIALNMDGQQIKKMAEQEKSQTTNTMGIGRLNEYHIANLCNAIRKGEKLRAPVEDAVKTNMLCHLGNIAQKYRRTLKTDPDSGRILNDPEAMKDWTREYEKGWAPKI